MSHFLSQLVQPRALQRTILSAAVYMLLGTTAGICQTTNTELHLSWEFKATGVKASLRGLSAASDEVLWAAGSNATVIRSVDGGSSWENCGPQGYPNLEFRSIHAWDATTACIASAGTPAIILLTENGGTSWKQVFAANSAAAFFDGLQFWDDDHGIAFSDPVDGHLLIVETDNAGRTWTPISSDVLPSVVQGEAGFAASNSSICVGKNGAVWIGTGGVELSKSRIHVRPSWKDSWQVSECPLPSGAAEGVFSIAQGGNLLIAVGGDYRPEASSKLTASLSHDLGLTWSAAKHPPAEFRSAVVAMPIGEGFLCVGPTGTSYSIDGSVWVTIKDLKTEGLETEDSISVGFHALDVGQRHIFAVGANGKFGKMQL